MAEELGFPVCYFLEGSIKPAHVAKGRGRKATWRPLAGSARRQGEQRIKKRTMSDLRENGGVLRLR
ncbi:hypothetical protein DW352_18290 [Pseudolabrys taiwanensis]|uniref:Uncharacterized protein n=1 Tax=Pseudolabrys taiwanensis TaxID=331696 RepID=A0A345ZZF3_9HYPH|nr:hypothetical protein DW352_18290 [Pseudolabrys taiwanensis]